MRRRPIVLSLTFALALAVGLAACGDDADPSADAVACRDAPEVALGAGPGRALPPTPIEEVIADTDLAVVGKVVEVLYTGPTPDHDQDDDVAGPIPPDACQVVAIEVTEVVRGAVAVGDTISVLKPRAPYRVAVGDAELWLARDADPYPVLLGNYGPGGYDRSEVVELLGA